VRLCYIDDEEMIMYFTNVSMDETNGDDWNDKPYEHNASPPYEEFVETRIVFNDCGVFHYPRTGHLNSPYSVDDINNGAIPWVWYPNHGTLKAGSTLDNVTNKLDDWNIPYKEFKRGEKMPNETDM
jgi:hypothetical protein